MKKILLLTIPIFLLSLTSTLSQTVHKVAVANFEFDPDTLTIQEGDVVEWTNAGGFHSIQGDLDAFPENPQGFGNEPSDENWQYSFTFNLEGIYDYRCGIHTASMLGRIIVEGTVGLDEEETGPAFVLFPNPINNYLRWTWNDNFKPEQALLTIFDLKGTQVKQVNLLTTNQLEMNDLSEGLYMYNVDMNEEGSQNGKLLIAR